MKIKHIIPKDRYGEGEIPMKQNRRQSQLILHIILFY